jgi:hypothetical protein
METQLESKGAAEYPNKAVNGPDGQGDDRYSPSTQPNLPKPKRDQSHLSRDEMILALQMFEAGKQQQVIAQVIGCSNSTISDLLNKFSDTRPLAKRRANHRALEVMDAALTGAVTAAKKGRPEAALEVVDRLEVLAKRQNDTGTGITIVFGTASVPGLPEHVIDIGKAEAP